MTTHIERCKRYLPHVAMAACVIGIVFNGPVTAAVAAVLSGVVILNH